MYRTSRDMGSTDHILCYPSIFPSSAYYGGMARHVRRGVAPTNAATATATAARAYRVESRTRDRTGTQAAGTDAAGAPYQRARRKGEYADSSRAAAHSANPLKSAFAWHPCQRCDRPHTECLRRSYAR
eukprot:6206970-Pleurochrysis_carterae.AAC.2